MQVYQSCDKMLDQWKLMLDLSGTVLHNASLWRQIILVTVYTTVLVCLDNFVDGFSIEFPLTLVTVLGFVTGLLLVFRTNTAYDRYWEGRKLWSSITHNIRTLIRYVWAVVDERETKDAVEKLTIVNLLVAFPFALKNYLREDYSYESENIRHLLRPLPRLAHAVNCVPKYYKNHNGCHSNPTFKQSDDPVLVGVTIIKEKARPKDSNASTCSVSTAPGSRRVKWRAHAEPTETNIPIEILMYFASYLHKLATQKNHVPVTFLNAMNSSLTALSDAVSGVERILQTPIPVAYAFHLKHTVWIYLLALPYQLVGLLNWWTIPAVTLATFALLGILHIGKEIENPFGMDDNDLPLDQICERIRREASLTVGRAIRNPSLWIMSSENQPLFPFNYSTAVDLCHKNLEEVHQLLMRRAETESVKM